MGAAVTEDSQDRPTGAACLYRLGRGNMGGNGDVLYVDLVVRDPAKFCRTWLTHGLSMYSCALYVPGKANRLQFGRHLQNFLQTTVHHV